MRAALVATSEHSAEPRGNGPPKFWRTFNGPVIGTGTTETINGRLEYLRGSSRGFCDLTNYVVRSFLETGGFRPCLDFQLRWAVVGRPIGDAVGVAGQPFSMKQNQLMMLSSSRERMNPCSGVDSQRTPDLVDRQDTPPKLTR